MAQRRPDKQPPAWTARREADMKRQGGQIVKPKGPTAGFSKQRPPESR